MPSPHSSVRKGTQYRLARWALKQMNIRHRSGAVLKLFGSAKNCEAKKGAGADLATLSYRDQSVLCEWQEPDWLNVPNCRFQVIHICVAKHGKGDNLQFNGCVCERESLTYGCFCVFPWGWKRGDGPTAGLQWRIVMVQLFDQHLTCGRDEDRTNSSLANLSPSQSKLCAK